MLSNGLYILKTWTTALASAAAQINEIWAPPSRPGRVARRDEYMYYATRRMLFILRGTDKILVFIYVFSLTRGDKTMLLYLGRRWVRPEGRDAVAEVGPNASLPPSCGALSSLA